MKRITFYISSHGFGHMTRCMALIDSLIKNSDSHIHMVCDSPQLEFARVYYHGTDRVTMKACVTDIGLINQPQSLDVDVPLLQLRLNEWIQELPTVAEQEAVYLLSKGIVPDLIVTDISVLGIMVAEAIEVPCVGVSNFTWSDQYEHLGLETDTLIFFERWYERLRYFYSYDLAIVEPKPVWQHRNVGIVSREVDYDRVKTIKETFGKSIYISCGKSASLSTMDIDFEDGTVFYTEGIHIQTNGRSIKLDRNIVDSQNYVAACDFIISKAGWGTIAEALVAGTPMVLMEREGVLEDSRMIRELKKRNRCISLHPDELKKIDVTTLSRMLTTIDREKLYNEADTLSSLLLEH